MFCSQDLQPACRDPEPPQPKFWSINTGGSATIISDHRAPSSPPLPSNGFPPGALKRKQLGRSWGFVLQLVVQQLLQKKSRKSQKKKRQPSWWPSVVTSWRLILEGGWVSATATITRRHHLFFLPFSFSSYFDLVCSCFIFALKGWRQLATANLFSALSGVITRPSVNSIARLTLHQRRSRCWNTTTLKEANWSLAFLVHSWKQNFYHGPAPALYGSTWWNRLWRSQCSVGLAIAVIKSLPFGRGSEAMRF